MTGVPVADGYPDDPGPEDAWVLSRLHDVVAEYDTLMDQYRFSDATSLLYNFAWSEVFDWYLEMAKTPLKDERRAGVTKQTLGVVLRDLLKLFHPIIPVLTEELWSELGDGSLLITSDWPTPPPGAAPAAMDELQELIVGVRRFRSEHQLGPRRELTLLVDVGGVDTPDWWREQLAVLGVVDVHVGEVPTLSLIHISEPTRRATISRMPSSA